VRWIGIAAACALPTCIRARHDGKLRNRQPLRPDSILEIGRLDSQLGGHRGRRRRVRLTSAPCALLHPVEAGLHHLRDRAVARGFLA
jgi:hypothetical protein